MLRMIGLTALVLIFVAGVGTAQAQSESVEIEELCEKPDRYQCSYVAQLDEPAQIMTTTWTLARCFDDTEACEDRERVETIHFDPPDTGGAGYDDYETVLGGSQNGYLVRMVALTRDDTVVRGRYRIDEVRGPPSPDRDALIVTEQGFWWCLSNPGQCVRQVNEEAPWLLPTVGLASIGLIYPYIRGFFVDEGGDE